ncbi:MAG TPA: Fic/DOC family N-terminal domain-containing protein [Polyangia bacterium]
MDFDRFEHSPIGRLVPVEVVEGERRWQHKAFLPRPLPTDRDLKQQTWRSVLAATAALSKLDGAVGKFPNPHLFVLPALIEEAVSTSALEGTNAAIEDVYQATLFDAEDLSDATAEVRNYVRAAEHGVEMIRSMPVVLRVIRETHGVLMREGRGDHAEAGSFRRRQSWIGPRRRSPITDSFFVPPPGDAVEALMNDWEAWVNRDSSTFPPVVRVALAHYQFETINPFIDGNGRVGRLAAVLTLIADGQLQAPILNLSPYFEDRRQEHVERLRETSASGDLDSWIEFFADAVRAQSDRALAKAERLIAAQQDVVGRVHAARLRGVALRIAEDLARSPFLTPTRAAKEYEVSYETANTAIGRLVDVGVLTEITGRSYGRVFSSPTIVALLYENGA